MDEKRKDNFVEVSVDLTGIEANKDVLDNIDLTLGKNIINKDGNKVGEITLNYEDGDKLFIEGKLEF